jgi:hypothetical protein
MSVGDACGGQIPPFLSGSTPEVRLFACLHVAKGSWDRHKWPNPSTERF